MQARLKELDAYFEPFRKHIIGCDATISTHKGNVPLVYADWTASGRMYKPIEDKLLIDIYPFVANTHTETNFTGERMTNLYSEAKRRIKAHVNANKDDILISSHSGMTGVVNKFQRIMGLRIHEKYKNIIDIPEQQRPIVFITHMEHHSNQTSWLETIADIEIIKATENGLVDLEHLSTLLDTYKNRNTKIAAVTSCSNVTGIFTPYHTIAKMMHQNNGLCFVDFACSAPYIDINMHPNDYEESLDAIYFSPHKFLGGPSSSGILVFNKSLYNNSVPDDSGGGTVDWTNPWGQHKYHDEIEAREDGGTPSFIQTMRVALAINLKDKMNTKYILEKEHLVNAYVFDRLKSIKNLVLLASNNTERLSIFSFYIIDLHYNLGVKMLNDYFGIQTRGGCSCAGTYGHYLLEVSYEKSKSLTDQISSGDLSNKPGWIRLSLHPTQSIDEIRYIMQSIEDLANNHHIWAKEYAYNKSKNDFIYQSATSPMHEDVALSHILDI